MAAVLWNRIAINSILYFTFTCLIFQMGFGALSFLLLTWLYRYSSSCHSFNNLLFPFGVEKAFTYHRFWILTFFSQRYCSNLIFFFFYCIRAINFPINYFKKLVSSIKHSSTNYKSCHLHVVIFFAVHRVINTIMSFFLLTETFRGTFKDTKRQRLTHRQL